MGCFMVSCCVTHTPIREGEQCYAAVFHPSAISRLGDSALTGELAYKYGLEAVVIGAYDDYGGIDGLGSNWNTGGPDSRVVYFFSEAAWRLGEELASQEAIQKWVQHMFRLEDVLDSLNDLADEIADCLGDDPLALVIREKGLRRYTPQFKQWCGILCALRTFCYQNNFAMFAPAFDTWYAGQELHLDEKKRWMQLRAERISTLEEQS